MKKAVSNLLCTIPIFIPLDHIYADVIYPGPVVISLIMIIGIGIPIAIIVFVSIWVIRRIKKKQTSKDDTQI